MPTLPFDILLITVATLSFASLYGILILSIKNKWFDIPGERSSHKLIVPRTAGIAIATLSLILLIFFGPSQFQHPFIFFTYIVFLIVGIYDDIKHLKASTKFWAQLFLSIGIAVLLPDFRIDDFYGVLGIYAIGTIPSVIFTSFVFVVVINAYNLIDGVDGLAASFSVFAIFMYAFAFRDINNETYYYCLLLNATLIPFFYFNLNKKRKLFLGDTGSLFLGTSIVLLTGYYLNSKTQVNVPGEINRALFALIALCYPLLDTLRVFTLRLTKGQSPFQADKTHIHHKLLKLGFSHVSTTLSLLSFNLLVFILDLVYFKGVDVNGVIVADFILIGLFFVGGLWYQRRKALKK